MTNEQAYGLGKESYEQHKTYSSVYFNPFNRASPYYSAWKKGYLDAYEAWCGSEQAQPTNTAGT